jgi:N-methylhydantoinase B
VNGEVVHPKGRYTLAAGEVISTVEPGGGGFGDPRERPVDRVLEDVRAGLVSEEGALRDYGVAVDLEANRAWRP